jgi:HD-GYP domain-containing protein (c-di-GMP phosphodiesterase class II)
MEELRAGKSTKYDPKVVDILLGIIERGELLCGENSHRRGAEDAEGSG